MTAQKYFTLPDYKIVLIFITELMFVSLLTNINNRTTLPHPGYTYRNHSIVPVIANRVPIAP